MRTNSIELCKLGLDFDALQNWRDAEHDNIPISGYRAVLCLILKKTFLKMKQIKYVL